MIINSAPDEKKGLGHIAKEAFWAYLCACAVGLCAWILLFAYLNPQHQRFLDSGAHAFVLQGSEFSPLRGDTAKDSNGTLAIQQFVGGEAILTLQRSFRAEDYPFIQFNITGVSNFSTAKIMWMKQGAQQVYSRPILLSNKSYSQIFMGNAGESYSGEVASIALLFYENPAKLSENGNRPIYVESVILRPFSAYSLIQQVFFDWSAQPKWPGHSLNKVLGTHASAILKPNIAVYLVSGISLLLLLFYHISSRRRRLVMSFKKTVVPNFLCICVFSLICNDALNWQHRMGKLQDAISRYSGRSLEDRSLASDIRCLRFKENCGSRYLPYF